MKKPALPFIALGLAAATVVTATAQELREPAPGEPGSVEWYNVQQSALHSLTAADGWSTLEGGIKFRRTAGDGTGPAPTLEDVVQVNYTGRFTNGDVFDSNSGSDPIEFRLGRLVRGWQVAIPYMGVGDSAEIAVPAEFAYGTNGAGPIPGGATLFFDIDPVGIPSQPGAASQ